jgi:hypothetical protein
MGECETQFAVIMDRVSYVESARSSPILIDSPRSMSEAKASEPHDRRDSHTKVQEPRDDESRQAQQAPRDKQEENLEV